MIPSPDMKMLMKPTFGYKENRHNKLHFLNQIIIFFNRTTSKVASCLQR